MSVIGETDGSSVGEKHQIEVRRVPHMAAPAYVWVCVRCGQTLEQIDQAGEPGGSCTCGTLNR